MRARKKVPYGICFRVVPAATASVSANLELANMDWEEFAACGDDDIFRSLE